MEQLGGGRVRYAKKKRKIAPNGHTRKGEVRYAKNEMNKIEIAKRKLLQTQFLLIRYIKEFFIFFSV